MDIKVCDNGFIKVDSYYVQGMQAVLNATGLALRDANFVPSTSCTCKLGHERTNNGRGREIWCEYKHTAYKHLVELRKKV